VYGSGNEFDYDDLYSGATRSLALPDCERLLTNALDCHSSHESHSAAQALLDIVGPVFHVMEFAESLRIRCGALLLDWCSAGL